MVTCECPATPPRRRQPADAARFCPPLATMTAQWSSGRFSYHRPAYSRSFPSVAPADPAQAAPDRPPVPWRRRPAAPRRNEPPAVLQVKRPQHNVVLAAIRRSTLLRPAPPATVAPRLPGSSPMPHQLPPCLAGVHQMATRTGHHLLIRPFLRVEKTINPATAVSRRPPTRNSFRGQVPLSRRYIQRRHTAASVARLPRSPTPSADRQTIPSRPRR